MRRWVLGLLVLASCGDDGDEAEVSEVALVTPVVPDAGAPRVERAAPPWPIFSDNRCDDACLLARYQRSWMHLQGMEVGGLEMMLGEALAGQGLLHAAITPPGGAFTVAACEAMSQDPIDVVTESLYRPQRDCYYACMSKTDPAECVRDNACAELPEIDGDWTSTRLSPRLGCLARIATPMKQKCQALEVATGSAGRTKVCSPRKACRDGSATLDPQVAPYATQPDTACDWLPLSWWCTEIHMEYPRAQCQYGRWKDQ
jgi:hypothetical protein